MENRELDGKKTIKSASYNLIANFVSMLVSLVAVKILTTILTTEEMGIAVNFVTLKALITIIVSCSLYVSIDKAILHFKNQDNQYLSSIYLFSCLTICLFFLIYILFKSFINSIFNITTLLMILMFIFIFLENGYVLITTYWNFKNKYIPNFVLSLLASPVAQLLSVLIVLYLATNKYMGRIIGLELFMSIVGIILGIILVSKAKGFFNKKYVKYGLSYSLPIMPHLISQIVLAQSDLLIINYYGLISCVGIYGIALTIATVLLTVFQQMLRPWSSWVYRRLHEHEENAIYIKSKYLIIIALVLSVGLMSVVPEFVVVILNKNYYDIVYILPILILGVYFQFMFILFYDILYYNKKTKSIMITSSLIAILNLVLNITLIPIFGYIVAAYTTALSYGLMALCYYFLARKLNIQKIYNLKFIFVSLIIVFTFTIINIIFKSNLYARWSLCLLFVICIAIKNLKAFKNLLKEFV